MDLPNLQSATVSAVKAIEQYSKSFQDAPMSCKSLLDKLCSIRQMLNDLESIAKECSGDVSVGPSHQLGSQFTSMTIFKQLNNDSSQLKRLQTTLDSILDWLKVVSPSSGSKMSLSGRLSWTSQARQRKIKQFAEALEEFKSLWTLILTMASLHKQEQERKAKRREGTLSWLKPTGFDYIVRHEASSRPRYAKSCGWLEVNKSFAQWRSSSGFLWLYGVPGGGKTILASYVIDLLKNQSDMTVAYHYCDFGEAPSTSPVAVFRSFLVQLLALSSRDWIQDFPDLASRKERSESPPTGLTELKELIIRAAKLHDRVVLVVDALDECEDRAELLFSLRELNEVNSISVFATSRKEQDIISTFRSLPYISLEEVKGQIEADLRAHVFNQLKTHQKLARLPEELRQEIVEVLLSKADGMFRWVQCQLDSISTCRTPKGVRDALRSLPTGLNETYERALLGILKQGEEAASIAQKCLMWLVGSGRPLWLSELQEAIMVEPGLQSLNRDGGVFEATEILEICGTLIETLPSWKKEDLCVRLSHFTVKEFLETAPWTNPKLSRYHIRSSEVQHHLAISTLTYLLFDSFINLPSDPSDGWFVYETPLYHYCRDYWSFHVKNAQDHDDIDELLQVLCTTRTNCLPVDTSSYKHDIHTALLHVAISEEITWIAERTLRRHPHLAASNFGTEYGSPLILAIRQGLPSVVDLLLDLGADVNLSAGTRASIDLRRFGLEHCSASPLIISALFGRYDIFQELLKHGADVYARIHGPNWTALHVAAASGNLPVTRALIKCGVDPDAVDDNGESALHLAVYRRQTELALELVQGGGDALLKSKSGKTPLHIAIDIHLASFINSLLSTGIRLADIGPVFTEQVDWAVSEPWYPELILTNFDYSLSAGVHVNTSPATILEIRRIFQIRFRLPSQVVDLILDLAEHWSHLIAQRNDVVDEQPYLSLKVDGRGPACVRRVTFTIKSHESFGFDSLDMTPTSDKFYLRPLSKFFTYFEAGIEYGPGGPERQPVPRREIQRNLFGSSLDRLHVNIWNYEDHSNWMKFLNPGDTLSVYSTSPSIITTFIQFVRVDVYCAW